MLWGNPNALWLLWLLPVVAALLLYARRRRAAAARRFADSAMAPRLMPAPRGARGWFKAAALLLGLACLIVAAARPRYGEEVEEVTARGVDLFVLLDVSRSMLAEDVKPNRLERAKSDIRDLLERLRGDRVGLIVYAGRPVVKAPLTTDHAFYRMVLDEIDARSAPRGGSMLGDGIRKALESMPKAIDRDQVIVLISDGGDQESYPLKAARLAAERSVKIIAVGLGDPNKGARIPLPDRGRGARYVTDETGQVVRTKLEQDLLREVALASGGAYVPAGTQAYDLGRVYDEHLANLTRGAISTERRRRYREQFQPFALLGLALLALEMLIPAHGRPPREKGEGARGRAGEGATRHANLARKAAWLVVCVGLFGASAAPGAKFSVGNDGLRRPSRSGKEWRAKTQRRKDAVQIKRGKTGDFRRQAAASKRTTPSFAIDGRKIPQPSRPELRIRRSGLQVFLLHPFFCFPPRLCVRASWRAIPSPFGFTFPTSYLELSHAPQDRRAAFNRACALAEQGKTDEARELLRAAALARDPKVAAASHYNLGGLALAQARAALGEEPLQAKPEARKQGLALLREAAEHYRDCLAVERNHADARHNLELIRLWTRRMRDAWDELDRRKKRQELEPLKFLDLLVERQRALRSATRRRADEPRSPRRWQAIYETEKTQRKLRAEIEPLKNKIADFRRAGGISPLKPPPAARLADAADRAMERAAQQLAAHAPRDALAPQGEAARALERIYLTLADFPRLVKKGIAVEKKLVEASKKTVEPAPPQPDAKEKRPPSDCVELADRQRFVTDLSRALPRLARATLRQIETVEHPRREEPRLKEGAPPEPTEEVVMPDLSPRQLAGLKESLQAALALAPEIERLTREAADDLTARNATAALPKQEEALRLLKEIIETMPPRNQNQQRNQRQQQDQRQQNQQPRNEQKQDQQDQKRKNERRKEMKQEQERKKKGQQKQPQDEQQAQQQQQPQGAQDRAKPSAEIEKRELTERQIKALLQKVRERQRAHRARMRALERYLQRRQNVEHDW